MIDKSAENQLESFLLEAMQQVIDENFSNDAGSITSATKKQEFEKCNQFMLITISSFNFKCLVMLHFSNDAGFRSLVAGDQATGPQEEVSRVFFDKLGEMCNVLSGTLKRKLEYTFNSIGMSTPQLLSEYSLDVFLGKNPDSTINLKADIGNKYVIISSVLLFLGRNCDFKLNVSFKNTDYLDQGDLLLF